jgi:hypothetical protein
LRQHDGAARIVAHDVERVPADIDADHGDRGFGVSDMGRGPDGRMIGHADQYFHDICLWLAVSYMTPPAE